MARDEVLLQADGERLRFPVHPRLQDGRTLAHVRLAEQLGATVEWDGTKVLLTKAGKRLEITPGQRTAIVDGATLEMGAGARMEEGRVLVPVRFFCEQLGATVAYTKPACRALSDRRVCFCDGASLLGFDPLSQGKHRTFATRDDCGRDNSNMHKDFCRKNINIGQPFACAEPLPGRRLSPMRA